MLLIEFINKYHHTKKIQNPQRKLYQIEYKTQKTAVYRSLRNALIQCVIGILVLLIRFQLQLQTDLPKDAITKLKF